MSKGKRWLAILAGLALLSGLSFAAWPRDCDESIDGQISARIWMANAWARLTGERRDCNPWSRVVQSNAIGGIWIFYFNSGLGRPKTTEYYIRPDGRGYVYRTADIEDPDWLNPDEFIVKIETGKIRRAYIISNERLYLKVKDLVGPLRFATGSIPEVLQQFSVGANGKDIIACDRNGYGSAYIIDWSQPKLADWSYFDNSGAYDRCPALHSAIDRLDEAKQLIEGEVPLNVLERWPEAPRID